MKNFNNRWQLPVDVSTVVRSQCLKGESRTQKKQTQGFIPIPCSAVFRICISFSAEPDPASYHNVDPDPNPDPGDKQMQILADPDQSPGETAVTIS
jgi:hypothetical protein